jgi:hypothetical protein
MPGPGSAGICRDAPPRHFDHSSALGLRDLYRPGALTPSSKPQRTTARQVRVSARLWGAPERRRLPVAEHRSAPKTKPKREIAERGRCPDRVRTSKSHLLSDRSLLLLHYTLAHRQSAAAAELAHWVARAPLTALSLHF